MLGLGSYDSSSDDDTQTSTERINQKLDDAPIADVRVQGSLGHRTDGSNEPTTEMNGPLLGPLQPQDMTASSESHMALENASPFYVSRGLIHDLTLPPVPNLGIPHSPTGSPDSTATGKLSHFLSLKSEGVHFHDKLSASSSLKNPSLLVKLRQHAGIDDHEQYAASIPADVWDYTSLPDWAYKEELLKSQQATRLHLESKKVTEKRNTVEFVPSTSQNEGKYTTEKGSSRHGR